MKPTRYSATGHDTPIQTRIARVQRPALAIILALGCNSMPATAQDDAVSDPAAAELNATATLPAVDAAALAEEIQARRPPPRELPAAVRAARVEAQITVPAAAGGAALTIARIAPPLLPGAPEPPRVVPAFTEEQRAAIRANAPLRNLLFSPTITVYPGGVSLVNWGAVDNDGGYLNFEAWVPYDFTSINLVGDFEVGRTRYSVLSFAHPAAGRALTREAPAAETLSATGGFRLDKGDPAAAAAMEPLRALLVIYAEEGPQLAANHAALQARQRAFEEWERQNPEPPRTAEIRFWPLSAAEAAVR